MQTLSRDGLAKRLPPMKWPYIFAASLVLPAVIGMLCLLLPFLLRGMVVYLIMMVSVVLYPVSCLAMLAASVGFIYAVLPTILVDQFGFQLSRQFDNLLFSLFLAGVILNALFLATLSK